jgi:hypothetical protein
LAYQWILLITLGIKLKLPCEGNILGSELFDKTDMTVSIDYIPKTQARKIATYAKEQLDILKHGATQLFSAEMPSTPQSEEYIEEVETEEVVNFAEIMPMTTPEYTDHQLDSTNSSEVLKGEGLRFISR